MADAEAPDLMEAVGFEKAKAGSGEKYQIKTNSLFSLMGGVMTVVGVMGAIVLLLAYDIRLERKSYRIEMRKEEHIGAKMYAQSQMQLWNQYHEHVKESAEATQLLESITKNYGTFVSGYKKKVDAYAEEIGVRPDKAAAFNEGMLRLIAEMQKDTMSKARKILAHIISEGKKDKELQERADKMVKETVKHEEEQIEEDRKEGIEEDVDGDRNDKDALDPILTGFFNAFQQYVEHFPSHERAQFEKGSSMNLALVALSKVAEEQKLLEDDVAERLVKITKDVSTEVHDRVWKYASTRPEDERSASNLVDVLTRIPMIPVEKLNELEKEWKDNKLDSMSLVEQLEELNNDGKIPESWFQLGVERQEEVDEEEEQEEEQEEQKQTASDRHL